MRRYVHYTTKIPGGHGAVREVIDMIIDSKENFDSKLEELLKDLR